MMSDLVCGAFSSLLERLVVVEGLSQQRRSCTCSPLSTRTAIRSSGSVIESVIGSAIGAVQADRARVYIRSVSSLCWQHRCPSLPSLMCSLRAMICTSSPMELIWTREVWSMGRTAGSDLADWEGRNTDRGLAGDRRHGRCLMETGCSVVVVVVAHEFEDNCGR